MESKFLFPVVIFIFFDWLFFQPSATSQTLFPILIAAQAVFLLAQLKASTLKWFKIALAIMLVTAIIYLIYSKSRAAWLGFAAGLTGVAWLEGHLNKRRLFWAGAGLVIAAFLVIFLVKTGSSNGRLLIYKVIAYNLSAGDLLTGIGPGQFKAQYNLWQARYFEHHNINSQEALLADNTFFAFNDYLQLAIETGVLGIVALLIALTCFLLLLRKLKSINDPGRPATGAAASIIVIATAALFSYPFQNPWIAAYIIACFAVLFYVTVQQRVLRYSFTALAISAIVLFGWKGARLQRQEQLKTKAITLAQSGYKRECRQLLQQMINGGCNDGHVLYVYAKELYLAGQADSALLYLHRAAGRIMNSDMVNLFARIYDETGKYSLAEQYYLTAIYMVPNRFEHRYNLVRFYTEHQQDALAAYWAAITQQLPVKIPSERVNRVLRSINNKEY